MFGGGCFAAGTPILTPEGSKLIEQIRPGDWVMAAPDDDPHADPVPRQVEEIFETICRRSTCTSTDGSFERRPSIPFGFAVTVGWTPISSSPGTSFARMKGDGWRSSGSKGRCPRRRFTTCAWRSTILTSLGTRFGGSRSGHTTCLAGRAPKPLRTEHETEARISDSNRGVTFAQTSCNLTSSIPISPATLEVGYRMSDEGCLEAVVGPITQEIPPAMFRHTVVTRLPERASTIPIPRSRART